MKAPFALLAIVMLGTFLLRSNSADLVEDRRALRNFISNLSPRWADNLDWNESLSVCKNWSGVTCSLDQSRVIALRLSGVKLNGELTPNTLGRLSALRTLNLSNNSLVGSLPSDLSNLSALTQLNLEMNKLTGPLPMNFSVWRNLSVIDLSSNFFNGSIPASISSLTHLSVLNLANNSLSGAIPDIKIQNLQRLSLANNNLSGNVPKSLQRFPRSSFAGNNVSFLLHPLSPSFPPYSSPDMAPVSPREHRRPRKVGESAILGIVIGFGAVAFALFAILLVSCRSRKKNENAISEKFNKGEISPEKGAIGGQDDNNGLVFFEGCSFAFDLEDLLRASAEVLGKGTVGTAYKAILEDATTVVVKRLKEVTVGRREFVQQLDSVGRIRHENMVELRAYFYSKDEKLVVYDYYRQGSVSSMLHAKRGGRRYTLDWDTRLQIAIGTARGVAHIHSVNSGKLVHGNIKSSNIFLNAQRYGCVSDTGLYALLNPSSPPSSRATGYRAPELVDNRKASHASDVYSVGVLLLELLTGKSAVHASGGEEMVHLVRWVQSVVREEWTAEVFDIELMRYPGIEAELVEMLQIAMACVVRMPGQRPSMMDVMKMIEDVRPVTPPQSIDQRPSSEAKSDDSGSPTPRSILVGEPSLHH